MPEAKWMCLLCVLSLPAMAGGCAFYGEVNMVSGSAGTKLTPQSPPGRAYLGAKGTERTP